MNTVVCKVEKCPYRSKSGFCRNKLTYINVNGACGHIYNDRGQIYRNWQQPIEEKYMNDYQK